MPGPNTSGGRQLIFCIGTSILSKQRTFQTALTYLQTKVAELTTCLSL